MGKVKQVLVLRKDLGMRKGKMVSQGAHAALGVMLASMRVEQGPSGELLAVLPLNKVWLNWLGEDLLQGEATKITVSVDSLDAMDELARRAEAEGLPVSRIIDRGHTEFHGAPTPTAIAIGPADAQRIDAITGHLSLL